MNWNLVKEQQEKKHDEQNFIESTNAGTKMSKNGNALFNEFLSSIPYELSLSKCSITLGKRETDGSTKVNRMKMPQLNGCIWLTTLLFMDNTFFIPLTGFDALRNEFWLQTIDRDATCGRWRCNYNRN